METYIVHGRRERQAIRWFNELFVKPSAAVPPAPPKCSTEIRAVEIRNSGPECWLELSPSKTITIDQANDASLAWAILRRWPVSETVRLSAKAEWRRRFKEPPIGHKRWAHEAHTQAYQ